VQVNVDCLLNRFRRPRERGFKEPGPDSNSLRGKLKAAASVAKAGNSKEGIISRFWPRKGVVGQRQSQEREKRGILEGGDDQLFIQSETLHGKNIETLICDAKTNHIASQAHQAIGKH
jgi:hypothetical protein